MNDLSRQLDNTLRAQQEYEDARALTEKAALRYGTAARKARNARTCWIIAASIHLAMALLHLDLILNL